MREVIHLGIAVERYNDPKLTNLSSSIADLENFDRILSEKYYVSKSIVLKNSEATRMRIEREFTNLYINYKENLDIIITLNGHGLAENGTYFFPLSDSQFEMKSTWYSGKDLETQIKLLDKYRNIAVIVNTCDAGALFQQDYFSSQRGDNYGFSRVIFTSSLSQQISFDTDRESNMSPFMTAIVSYLKENSSIVRLNLLNVIGFTKYAISNEKISLPREGYFTGHGGGDFLLTLRNTEEADWEKAKMLDNVEGYSFYLNNHPQVNEERVDFASQRLKEFRDEVDFLTKSISLTLVELKKYDRFSDTGLFTREMNQVKVLLEQLYNAVTGDKEAENTWNEIRLTKEKAVFSQFIENFPNSPYAKLAKKIEAKIENQEKDRQTWDEVLTSKNTATLSRIGRLKIYIEKFPYGDYVTKAYSLIEDMTAFYDIENQKDTGAKISMLEKYLNNPNYTEYQYQAKKLLDEINFENKISALEKELDEYILNENDEQIEQLQEFLNGHREDEIKKMAPLIEKAEEYIKRKQEEVKDAADIAINSKEPRKLQHFISIYPKSQLTAKVKSVFDSLDIEAWTSIENSLDITEIEEYIQAFQGTDAGFLDKAKDYLVELKFFEECNSLDDYELYTERFGEVGLMIKEARERIEELDYQARMERDYSALKEEGRLEKYEKFLQNYGFENIYSDTVVTLLNKERAEKKRLEILSEINEASGINVLEIIKREIDNVGADLKSELEEIEQIANNEKTVVESFEEAFEARHLENIVELKDKIKEYLYFEEPQFDDAIGFLRVLATNDVDQITEYCDENKYNKFSEQLELEKDALIAKKENSEDSYANFLSKYSDSRHHSEFEATLERLRELRLDKEEFDQLMLTPNESDLLDYIGKSTYKNEEHVKEVKRELIRIQKEQDEKHFYEGLVSSKSEQKCVEYLSEYKNGKYRGAVKALLAEILTTDKQQLASEKINYWKYSSMIMTIISILLILYILKINM